MGAALAIALAAPQLLSGVAADGLERHLEGRIAGDVEILDLELHWSESQRAGQVRVHTLPGEDGERGQEVANFSLRFPSLLDLLAESSTEWKFKITDAKFTARVDADGTSDLGRSLGLEAADGRTELVAFLAVLGDLSNTIEGDGNGEYGERSVRTVMSGSQVRFIDMPSGTGTDRTEATLSGFFLKATKSRVGFQIDVRDALVQHSVDQEARVSFGLNFSGAGEAGAPAGSPSGSPSGAALLRSAHVTADPIPLETLRLMGVAPRRVKGQRAAKGGRANAGFGNLADATDFYRPMGSALFDGLEVFFEDGASVEATYGVVLGNGAASTSTAGRKPRLEIHVAGDFGEVDLVGEHDGEWLTGSRSENGEPALGGGFNLSKDKLKSVLETLAPLGGIEIQDPDRNAKWYLESNRFSVPLRSQDLSVTSFFGGALGDSGETRAADASPGPRGGGNGWRRFFAQALRRTDAVLTLSSRGSDAAKLVLLPSNKASQRANDRLDWTHLLTEVVFTGDLGASVDSRWSVAQSNTYRIARLNLTIPGAALMPGDNLVPRLDVHLPAVPVSLIKTMAQLPEDLASLLPYRLDRLTLLGLPLPQLLAAKGTPRRPSDTPIEVVATIDSTDQVAGTYERGVMTIPKASLTAPLDKQFCEGIIMGYMPWFESVEPSDGGELQMELRNFSFSMGETEFKQTGEVILGSSPLRVRLLPQIAAKLSASESERESQDEDAPGLLAWTPGSTVLTLDGLRVGYAGIELPLSDDYTTSLEGSYYRGDGKFSLSGLVESQFIKGPEGSDALWLIAINGTVSDEGSSALVTFDPGTIDPSVITDFMRKASEMREKVK